MVSQGKGAYVTGALTAVDEEDFGATLILARLVPRPVSHDAPSCRLLSGRLCYRVARESTGTAPPGIYLASCASTNRAFAPNLDSFPLPEPDIWLLDPHAKAQRIPVQSRRGCPLDCIYCSTSAIEGKPVRGRSSESIVSWLARLRARGFQTFYFVDNTFNLPPSYAKGLCRQLIQTRLVGDCLP